MEDSNHKNGKPPAAFWEELTLPNPEEFEPEDQRDVQVGNSHLQYLWEKRDNNRIPWLVGSLRWRLLASTTELFAHQAGLSRFKLEELENPKRKQALLLDSMSDELSVVAQHWNFLIQNNRGENGHAAEKEILKDGLHRFLSALTGDMRMKTQALLHHERLLRGPEDINEALELQNIKEISSFYQQQHRPIDLNKLMLLPLKGKQTWHNPQVWDRVHAYIYDRQVLGMRRDHATLRAVIELGDIEWTVAGLVSVGLVRQTAEKLLAGEAVPRAEVQILERVPRFSKEGMEEALTLFPFEAKQVVKPGPKKPLVVARLNDQPRAIRASGNGADTAAQVPVDVSALREWVAMHEPASMRRAMHILAETRGCGIEKLSMQMGLDANHMTELMDGKAPLPFWQIEDAFDLAGTYVPARLAAMYHLERAKVLSEAHPSSAPLGQAFDHLVDTWLRPDDADAKQIMESADFRRFVDQARRGELITNDEKQSRGTLKLTKTLLLNDTIADSNYVAAFVCPAYMKNMRENGQMSSLRSKTYKNEKSKAVWYCIQQSGNAYRWEHMERLKEMFLMGPLPSRDDRKEETDRLTKRKEILQQWSAGKLDVLARDGIDTQEDSIIRSLVELMPGITPAEFVDIYDDLHPLFINDIEAPVEKENPAEFLADQGTFRKRISALLPHKPRGKNEKAARDFCVQKLYSAGMHEAFPDGIPEWIEPSEKFFKICIATTLNEHGADADGIREAQKEIKELIIGAKLMEAERIAVKKKKKKGEAMAAKIKSDMLPPPGEDNLFASLLRTTGMEQVRAAVEAGDDVSDEDSFED